MSPGASGALRRVREPLKRIRDGLLRRGARVAYALGVPRPVQIVICGYPRSGTSLLYNMLSASLDGFHFGKFEVPCVHHVRTRSHFVSKRPLDVFELEKLCRGNVFEKELFAIVVIRDLRDVITSIHPRVPHDYFIGYEASYAVGDDFPHGSKLLHPGVRGYYERIEQLDELVDLTLVRVRYEDLIAQPDAVQQRLADALRVRFARRFAQFHEHPERHAYRYAGAERAVDPALVRESDPVDGSRLGKWRSDVHRERIRSQFRAHPELFEMLCAYGYEPDAGWFEAFERAASAAPAGAERD
ncbi:MAG: sulfotransferase domain-containing protein [Myxococcales bacterium]|nr:sulfotransferase domain-containing protein [Myxococcales bacterium]MDH5306283.1 sulfotransferase domain-containing protein [Myxococcales bacterium]MDH5565040.1 sulfotransferase domain-containing protein [Myxococcales bacterium]